MEADFGGRLFEASLADVAALSVDVNRTGFARFILSSLQEDVLSLPCDGVSETRLCVSSNPSSFSSCDINLLQVFSPLVLNNSFEVHSLSGVGDFKLLMASRTSS